MRQERRFWRRGSPRVVSCPALSLPFLAANWQSGSAPVGDPSSGPAGVLDPTLTGGAQGLWHIHGDLPEVKPGSTRAHVPRMDQCGPDFGAPGPLGRPSDRLAGPRPGAPQPQGGANRGNYPLSTAYAHTFVTKEESCAPRFIVYHPYS